MTENELNNDIRGRAITMIPQDPSNSFHPLFTIGTYVKDIIAPRLQEPKSDQKQSLFHKTKKS